MRRGRDFSTAPSASLEMTELVLEMAEGLTLYERTRSTLPPTGGMGQPKVCATIVLAFSPVVTNMLHCGICANRAGISVGVTTSRKASAALSFRRRTSQAVS